MMQVKSFKRGIEERNAYCTECIWSDHTMRADTKARYHTGVTGHQVDVYTETRRRIKIITVK